MRHASVKRGPQHNFVQRPAGGARYAAAPAVWRAAAMPLYSRAMQPSVLDTPFQRHEETVRAEWIDYNGHMNLAYYVLVFDHATDALFDALDVGRAYLARTGRSMFAAEIHVSYGRELRLGDRVRVATRVLAADAKRLHFFHEMFHAAEGWRAAACELMALHVDLATRRTAPFADATAAVLQAAVAAHGRLPPVEGAGRRIGFAR